VTVAVNAARQVADALRVIRAKAESEAPLAACNALGQAAETGVKTLLSLTSHPAATKTPSPRGEPPSKVSGKLGRSMKRTPAVLLGEGVSRCAVGSNLIYAPVHEFGPVVIRAKNFPQLGNPQVGFFGKEVTIPQRPYLRPTVLLLESTGMAERVTTDAWRAVMNL
jgi:phage gpG-like protein